MHRNYVYCSTEKKRVEFARLAIFFFHSVGTKLATNVSSVIQGHVKSNGKTGELICKAGRI